MAFLWRADDGPTLNAGLVALWFLRGPGPVLLRNPIFLWFNREGGIRIPCPHLWIRPWCWSYGCTSRLTNLAALCCTCSKLWISLLWCGSQTMYEYSRLVGVPKWALPPGVCAPLIPENNALISPNPWKKIPQLPESILSLLPKSLTFSPKI